jgi:hypothetical protein
MDALHIAVEMLNKLRPKIWVSIVFSIVFIGMVSIQFCGSPLDFKVTIKEILVCTIGLAALIFVWINYHFSMKTYCKYQVTLISMTKFKGKNND